MRLTMQERKKATAITAGRYQKSRKKGKGMILDEFIELTGYNRSYAANVLRSHGKRVWVSSQRVYDETVVTALKKFWQIMAKAAQSLLAETGGFISSVTSIAGLGITAYEGWEQGFSDRALDKMLMGVSMVALGATGPVGAGIAAGYSVLNMAGVFDGMYGVLDNTPRINRPVQRR